jgi:hypothetical protein
MRNLTLLTSGRKVPNVSLIFAAAFQGSVPEVVDALNLFISRVFFDHA